MKLLDEAKDTVEWAIAKAAKEYGVLERHIRSGSRQSKVTAARHLAMHLSSNAGVSDAYIGMHMDRDPSSVHHGRKQYEKRAGLNVPFRTIRNQPTFKTTRKETQ